MSWGIVGGTAESIITSLPSGFNSGTTVKPSLNPMVIEKVIGSGIYTVGAVAVGIGKCNLYATSNFVGYPKEYTMPGATLSLTEGIPNYLVAKLNADGKTAVWVMLTDASAINSSNMFPVYTLAVYKDELNVTDWDSPGYGLSNKLLRRMNDIERFGYVNGLILGESGIRNVLLSAGKVWTGVSENTYAEVNSAVDKVRLVCTDSSGNWVAQDITQYPNDLYDNGHGTSVLTTGTDSLTYRYAVLWVYRTASNAKSLAIFLGKGDYTFNEAVASQEPTVAEEFRTNAFLVGRIIVKKNDNLATQIDSAWEKKFEAADTSNHEGLMGLQGGGLDTNGTIHHYHSDQPINTTDDVVFKSVTANEATETKAGLMPPALVKKLNGLSAPLKNNLSATAIPTVTDDSSGGYAVDSQWIYNNITYICKDASKGSAVWINTSTDIVYVDTWQALIALVSVAGTTYVNKYVSVANANGGPGSGITYTAPNGVSNAIVDGGSATYKVLAQGSAYSVTCQKRTITNPVITSIMLAPTSKPTSPGYYIFTVSPSDGLPGGINLNDIACYDGSNWSLYQSYATATTVLVANNVAGTTQVTWRKFAGTWMSTADEFNTDKVEYQTGKLWNGKPVYRRGCTGNTTNNASTGVILPLGFKLVSCWMTLTRSDGVTCQVMSSGNEVMISISSARELSIWVGNSLYANVTYYAWVEYTKS